MSINVHCLNEFFKKNISNLLNFKLKFYSILHVSILIEFIGILYALITHLFFIYIFKIYLLSAGVQKVSLRNRYEDNERSFIQMV